MKALSIQHIVTLVVAVLYGLALAYLQDKGVLLILGAIIALTALKYCYNQPSFGLSLAIVIIGLCPFFFSLRVFPGLPKLYAEDFLFFFFLTYLFLVYGFMKQKSLHMGEIKLVIFLLLFILATAVPFFTESIAQTGPRNFTETVIFGIFFYILFLNETKENNIEILIAVIAITTLLLSAMLCIEVVAQTNPLMKIAERVVDNFIYLAPQDYTYAGGYYRPYAVYFHPSEAGTFVAMGLPFVYYFVRQKHFAIKYSALLLLGAGIAVNFTRGVWLALALTLCICNLKHIKRYLPALASLGMLGAGILALRMSSSGFSQRILDPSNLENRFYYWKVGFNMFTNYFPFGVGHMNFRSRYMEFIDTAQAPFGLDVEQIFVADNVLLTTLVEHGILGFAAQTLFYITAVWIVAQRFSFYQQHNDTLNASRMHIFLQALLIYLLAGLFADVQLFTKVTKMFFIILGMAMAVSRFVPLTERPFVFMPEKNTDKTTKEIQPIF